MDFTEYQYYKQFATTLARHAGKLILSSAQTPMKVEWKENNSPVTVLDKHINDFVISKIHQTFPAHNIIAEEGGNLNQNNEFTWLCDPLDGTLAFSLGIPTSVFSLALVHNGESIFSVIYDPYKNNLYHAARGHGAYLNDQQIFVSTWPDLQNSVIGLTIWRDAAYDCMSIITALREQRALPINVTSSQYMGALVAAGRLQGIIYFDDKPYDGAAVSILVEEAGGIITDLFGNKQRYDRPIKGYIASTLQLHNFLVEAYAKFPLSVR